MASVTKDNKQQLNVQSKQHNIPSVILCNDLNYAENQNIWWKSSY